VQADMKGKVSSQRIGKARVKKTTMEFLRRNSMIHGVSTSVGKNRPENNERETYFRSHHGVCKKRITKSGRWKSFVQMREEVSGNGGGTTFNEKRGWGQLCNANLLDLT